MSENFAKFAREAELLELSGEDKRLYIKECLKEERDREERERERDREEREREREERERERDREERQQEREKQREKEEKEERQRIRDHELEMERIRIQARPSGENISPRSTFNSSAPKLPAFVDHKDDLDSFLTRFERFGEMNEWPLEDWPIHLSALLSGRALDAFCRLGADEAKDYGSVKLALQRRYNLTEEGYRLKFRQSRPDEGENASMFIVRLKTYLERWVKLSDTNEEFGDLCNLLVKEQFMESSPGDLAIHLREKRLRTVDELAMEADAFLSARNRKLNSRKQTQHSNVETRTNNDRSKNSESRYDDQKHGKDGYNAPRHRKDDRSGQNMRCHECHRIGHLRRSCPLLSDTKSGPKRAAVGIMKTQRGATVNLEVAEKATGTCDGNGKVDRSVAEEIHDGNIELASGRTVPVITNCGACDGLVERQRSDRLPIMKGLVEDKLVDTMRDSGADCVVVRRDLVNKGQLTGKTCFILRIDNTMIVAEEAVINVKTPYLSGRVRALCIPNSICDLVIGNVEGARNPDDPDTSVVVGAATTRAQDAKNGKSKTLAVPKMEGHVGVDRSELIKLQNEDEEIQDMIRSTSPKTKGRKTVFFEKKNGVVYRIYKDDATEATLKQVMLPKSLRKYVMSVAHDSIKGGHQGIRKTKDKVLSNFYWRGVEGDVARYCRSCDVCQKTVSKGLTPRAPLQSIPVVDVPFKKVAVDLVGPIHPPSEEGHRYILTLVDFATRYPEAVPLKKIDTETVAEALVNIYTRIGIPEEILSDQGTQFVSDCMKEVNRLLGITQSTTTPFHPMCNGLVEKYNGTLKKALSRLCTEQPRQWHRFINPVLFAYREVPQESTKFAPFELLYGRSVRGPMNILKQLWTKDIGEEEVRSSYQYVMELRERLEETWKLAQQELEKAQRKQKFYYDRGVKARKLKPGDKVLVLLPTESNKLLMQWKGPYEIISAVGINDYKVRMGRKEKTLHINLLKRYIQREEEGVASAGKCGKETMCAGEGDVIEGTPNEQCEEDETICDVICSVAVIEEETVEDNSNDDLAELGSWRQKESAKDIVFGRQLTETQIRDLESLVDNYSHTFTDLPGNTTLAEHRIDLTCETPIRQRAYNVPFALRDSLRQELQTMEELGIIRKSSSPFAAPVVVVKKKDGSNRICIDYRRLNKVTIFDPHPATPPADVFQGLAKDKFFSKIDLSKGYWQIPVRQEDIPKTAFVTMDHHYEFIRMPFGMMNSGSTLNRAVKILLEGMNNVTAYVDDLLVHTESFDHHLEVLEELFRRLSEANVTVRPSKCVIASSEVEFVGHWLGRGTITLQDDIVSKVRDAPRPRTKKDVRAFLGLVLSNIASPLTDLNKRGMPNIVVWEEKEERAYSLLKNIIISKPILHLPDINKLFTIRTDASDRGLGAVLLQEVDGSLFPIAFASRKLLNRERNYSAIEKECLAIVWGIQKFSLYLYGRQFVLQTDHFPLQYLNAAKFENSRIMRWALCLQRYNFNVEHIKGSDNVGADFLSRVIN